MDRAAPQPQSSQPQSSQPQSSPAPTDAIEQPAAAAPTDDALHVPAGPPPVTLFPDLPAIPRDQLILLGNPRAEFVLIECLAYTCAQCRSAYPLIKEVQKAYGDRLAIAVIPIPLEKSCNPGVERDYPMHRNGCKLTRLALAVWELSPTAYVKFHDWLMTSEDYQRYNTAWQVACSLVPEAELIDMVSDDRVQARIDEYNKLLDRVDRVPAVIVGSKMIKGKVVADEKVLKEFVRNQLEGQI